MHETLTMRTARQRVREYRNESEELIARRRDATDSRDCEAFLQLGIDAFDWLVRADAEIRIAVAEDRLKHDEVDVLVDEGLKALCRLWLLPCAKAHEWARARIAEGFDLDNLPRFVDCCEEMEAIVEFNGSNDAEASLPTGLMIFSNQAIEEFRNGRTSEFI